MGEKILRRRAVLLMLGIASATLHRRIKDGTIPPPLRLGPNSVGWKESTILAVIDGFQTVNPENVKTVAPGAKRGRKPRNVAVEGKK
jgi:predicted DNA-binding transcriptional regulator AlpA